MTSHKEEIENLLENVGSSEKRVLKNRERIERMLDELAAGLASFVNTEMTTKLDEDWADRVDKKRRMDGRGNLRRLTDCKVDFSDPQDLLQVLRANEQVFQGTLWGTHGKQKPSWVKDLQDARNYSSHRDGDSYRNGDFDSAYTKRLLRKALTLLSAAEDAQNKANPKLPKGRDPARLSDSRPTRPPMRGTTGDSFRPPMGVRPRETAARARPDSETDGVEPRPAPRSSRVLSQSVQPTATESATTANHLEQGREAEQSNNLDASKEAFGAESEPNPNDELANFLQGEDLFKEGRFSDALPYFQCTLEIKPDHAPSHHYVGGVYLERGEPTKAKKALLRAEDLNLPSEYTPWNHHFLACALWDLESYHLVPARRREARKAAGECGRPELQEQFDADPRWAAND